MRRMGPEVPWRDKVNCLTVEPVFRTVQSVRPGGRTGRTAGGSPSFFESMDGLWEIELGPEALWGPVGPCGLFALGSLLPYV